MLHESNSYNSNRIDFGDLQMLWKEEEGSKGRWPGSGAPKCRRTLRGGGRRQHSPPPRAPPTAPPGPLRRPRNSEDEARDLALTPRNAVTKERKRCNLLKTCYFVGFSILRRAPVFCFCIYVGCGVSVLQLSLGTLASLIPEINRPTEKERCMRLVL